MKQDKKTLKLVLTMFLVVVLLCSNVIILTKYLPRDHTSGKTPADEVTYVSPVTVQPPSTPAHIDHGEVIVFKGRTEPLAASSDGLTWTSDNGDVASVDSYGQVTGLAVGDTTVTVTSDHGDTAVWTVKVRKTAYLTFDDFPNEYTVSILDTLQEKHAVATFFLNATDKEGRSQLYERIMNEGHAIGNHTASHNRERIFQSVDVFMNDIYKMEAFLEEKYNTSTKFVRIPYGSCDSYRYTVRQNALKRLREEGYTVVDWTIDSRDSYNRNPDVLLRKIQKGIEITRKHKTNDVEIILMHNLEGTSKALPSIIDWLRNAGYEFERIDDAPQAYLALQHWEENKNRRSVVQLALPDPFEAGEDLGQTSVDLISLP